MLDDVFRQHDFAGLMHFASFKVVGESVEEPFEYYANNVGGSLALFEAMRDANVFNLVLGHL